MNCHTFSSGLGSGHLGRSGIRVMLDGTTSSLYPCHPAGLSRTTGCAPSANRSHCYPDLDQAENSPTRGGQRLGCSAPLNTPKIYPIYGLAKGLYGNRNLAIKTKCRISVPCCKCKLAVSAFLAGRLATASFGGMLMKKGFVKYFSKKQGVELSVFNIVSLKNSVA